jgi:hypothetical protein
VSLIGTILSIVQRLRHSEIKGRDEAAAHPGSAISFPVLGTPTYDDHADFARFCGTAGRITGGTMTDAGSGNLTVAAGCGTIRASASTTAELYFFDWAQSTGNAIPAGTVRYVGVKYNSGSPVVDVRTVDNWNYYDEFPLGMVANVGGTLHINQDGREFADQLGRLIRRFYGTRPYERDERQGGLVIGETGTRNVTLSAGRLWDRSNNFDISAIDTSGADRFTSYYRDGAGGFTEVASQSQWPNTQYDDNSGTLATMTVNRYACLWFYVETDGNLVMLYGRGQYATVASAVAEGIPSTVPARITASGRLLGRFIFQKSAATAHSIETVWSATLSATGATDHGGLSGLSDLDHPASAIINTPAGNIAATDVQAALNELDGDKADLTHASRHNAGGADALAIDAAAATGSLRTLGTASTAACAGNDARLSDARTPTAHATSHKSGGSDSIKLDELAAPTDVTTLNASTSAHGLLKKLSNVATEFMNGAGNWATPSGGTVDRSINMFRVTLESGVAVSTTDQTAKTTVYLCPVAGGASTEAQMSLYDGSAWVTRSFTQLSLGTTTTRNGTTANGLATITGLSTTKDLVVGMEVTGTGVGGGAVISSIDSDSQVTLSANSSASATVSVTFKCPASKNYDLFVVDISSTPTFVFGPVWTSDTARATAITQKDGVPVLTGSFTVAGTSYAEGRLRHVGAVGTTATAGQTEFSMTAQYCKLLICSVGNEVPIRAFSQDPTTSWSYTTAASRQLRGDTNNKIEFILCDSRSIFSQLSIQVMKAGFNFVSLDTVAYPAADPTYNNGAYLATTDAGDTLTNVASLAKTVAYGRHAVIPSEFGLASNTTYGENNMGFLLEVEL